jgi:hypothetical protein
VRQRKKYKRYKGKLSAEREAVGHLIKNICSNSLRGVKKTIGRALKGEVYNFRQWTKGWTVK